MYDICKNGHICRLHHVKNFLLNLLFVALCLQFLSLIFSLISNMIRNWFFTCLLSIFSRVGYMPCPFTGSKIFVPVQIFCIVPKIYLHIVPVTNILCQNKKWFAFSKIGFCAEIKVFEEVLNTFKFLDCSKNLDRHKTFWDL